MIQDPRRKMIAHIQKCTEEEMQNQLLIEGAEYEKPAFSNTATALSDSLFFLYKKCHCSKWCR